LVQHILLVIIFLNLNEIPSKKAHLSKMGTRWSVDEDVALFAWLNFCNESGVSYRTTIQEKVAEVGAERTWRAIQKRLEYLVGMFRAKDENNLPLKSNGEEDDGKLSVILEQGTKCLQNPSEDFRKKFKPAIQKYRKGKQENVEKLQSNEQSEPQPLAKRKAASYLPVSSPKVQTSSGASGETEQSSRGEETKQHKRQRLNQV
jgi:hypothetical protein